MPQQNPILQQQVQVKEKTQTMQKVVLGTGIFCATITLINFALLFNAGVQGLNRQFIEQQQKNSIAQASQTATEAKAGLNINMYEGTSTCGLTGKSYNFDVIRGYIPGEEITVEEALDEAVLAATDIINGNSFREKVPSDPALNFDVMAAKINSQVFKDWVIGKITDEEAEKLDWCNGTGGCTPTGVGSCGGSYGWCGTGSVGGIGGWGSCLLKGTKVTLANGNYAKVEDIQPGDLVKAYDATNHQVVNSAVVRTFNNTAGEYLVINNKLRITPNHRFYVLGNWVPANELKIGDELLTEDGSKVIVQTIEKVTEPADVYNFQVKDYNNYFAEDYLVHNYKWNSGSKITISFTIHF